MRKVMKMGGTVTKSHNKLYGKYVVLHKKLAKAESTLYWNQVAYIKETRKVKKSEQKAHKKAMKAVKGLLSHVQNFADSIEKDKDPSYKLPMQYFGTLLLLKDSTAEPGTGAKKVFAQIDALRLDDDDDEDDESDAELEVEGAVPCPLMYDNITLPGTYADVHDIEELAPFSENFKEFIHSSQDGSEGNDDEGDDDDDEDDDDEEEEDEEDAEEVLDDGNYVEG